MSWSRAVWIENEEEMEAVIPSNWIQNGKVYWPSKMNVKKAFKEQADPEENWLMFSLIKVKLKDGTFYVFGSFTMKDSYSHIFRAYQFL